MSRKTDFEQAVKSINDGNRDAALIFLSSLGTDTPKGKIIRLGSMATAVNYVAGIVKKSKNQDFGRDIITLTKSPEGKSILKKYNQEPL